jgi:hypothetical protein
MTTQPEMELAYTVMDALRFVRSVRGGSYRRSRRRDGCFATADWVASQWQLPLIPIVVLRSRGSIDRSLEASPLGNDCYREAV